MPAATFIMLADLAGELVNGINTESSCDIDALVTTYFMDRGWDIGEL